MSRSLIVFLLMCLIGLAIFYPAIERVDFWDHFPQTGNETELNVLGTLSLVGLGVIIGLLMPLIGNFLAVSFPLPAELTHPLSELFCVSPILTPSPPPQPLRI